MTRLIRNFFKKQSGAVTVDWVVLTAAIVGLAAGGIAATQSGVVTLSNKVSAGIIDETVK